MDQSDTDEEGPVDMGWLEEPTDGEPVREYTGDTDYSWMYGTHEEDYDAETAESLGRRRRQRRRYAPGSQSQDAAEDRRYRERQRRKEFSRRFGWIFGIVGKVYDGIMDWFVVDVVWGMSRGAWGLILLAVVFVFGFIAQPAIQKAREQRKQPADVRISSDGSPQASGTSNHTGQ